MTTKHRPGEIRDAILEALITASAPMSIREIEEAVADRVPNASSSSVRSYLRLNTPDLFTRPTRAHYLLREQAAFTYSSDAIQQNEPLEIFEHGKASLIKADCFEWLRMRQPNSLQAVVTDPPYGLVEYSPLQQAKLRAGRGGVWRIPPSFDGARRQPLPRFTVLKSSDLEALHVYFVAWARLLLPTLVPGAAVIVASNPLVSYVVSGALARAGLERRGEIVRLVMTMRGGDRPKAAHYEFSDVSVMPRAMWEPWLVFRKPLEGRVQDNLRRWKTGGFRRPSKEKPFGDVIHSAPTGQKERSLAPHPSLKPQAFLRQLVRAVLPLGEGLVFDPFAGAGSTLAAATAVDYESIGVEKDETYFEMAKRAIPELSALELPNHTSR